MKHKSIHYFCQKRNADKALYNDFLKSNTVDPLNAEKKSLAMKP